MSSFLSESAFDILLSLASGPKHGYSMVQEIGKVREGRTMQPGLLYTTLPKLIQAGLIELAEAPADNTDKRRRYYRLTQNGSLSVRAEAARRVDQAKKIQALAGELSWGH